MSQELKANAGKSPRFFWAAPRTPVHPGHFLETRYLQPGKISQEALALALGISRRRVNELVCGKRVITPDTAVRLALHFGTDVAFWLELQFAWELHQAQQMYYKQVKSRGSRFYSGNNGAARGARRFSTTSPNSPPSAPTRA